MPKIPKYGNDAPKKGQTWWVYHHNIGVRIFEIVNVSGKYMRGYYIGNEEMWKVHFEQLIKRVPVPKMKESALNAPQD